MSSESSTTPTSAPTHFTFIVPTAPPLPSTYNDAAFLHVLATHPAKVIPPGKSLRAVLLRPDAPTNDTGAPNSLHSTVEEIVHRAFWDEARESLADPTPSRQLARLRLLYGDLHTALAPLLPKTHPSILTLSDPLSPTPAPLRSARRHLSELAAALQTRCAPVRDSLLSDVRTALQSEDAASLAERIVQAVKDLLQIAELMKSDLSSAVLGAVTDEDLEAELVRSARVEERRAVLELFGAQAVRERWKAWVTADGTDSDNAWIHHLVKALGADVAISCPLPTSSKPASDNANTQSNVNALPPPFLFSAPDLFHLQNHLQALVIAAVLRTLVPLRSVSATATTEPAAYTEIPENHTFASRVLSLLMIEVDESTQDAGSTKLINLADEVLREHQRLNNSSSTEESKPPSLDEKTLRSRVDVLLQPTNGVFTLLRKRLLTTLSDGILSALRQHHSSQNQAHIPEKMQTGRDRKRPKLDGISLPSLPSITGREPRDALRRAVDESIRAGNVSTKGFEDPVLQRGVGAALRELADIVEWVAGTWANSGLGLDGLEKEAEEELGVRRATKARNEGT